MVQITAHKIDRRKLNDVYYAISGNGVMTVYGTIGSKNKESVILQNNVLPQHQKDVLGSWIAKLGQRWNHIREGL